MEVLEEHEDFRKSLPLKTPPKLDITIDYRFASRTSRRLMMVLDTSGSMQGAPMFTMQFGVTELIENYIQDGTTLGITAFSSTPRTLVGMTKITSMTVRENISRMVKSLVATGGTGLSEAIAHGIRLAGCTFQTGRKISCPKHVEIILLTDGVESPGGISLPDVIAALPGTKFTIHVVVFGQNADIRLMRLNELTGGKAVYANTNNPIETLRGMIDILKENIDNKNKPIELLSEKVQYNTTTWSKKIITFDGKVTADVTLIFTYQNNFAVKLVLTGPQGQSVDETDRNNYKVLTQQHVIKIKVQGIFVGSKSKWTLKIYPPGVNPYQQFAAASGGIYITGKTEAATGKKAVNLQGHLSTTKVDTANPGDLAVYAMLIKDFRPLIEPGLQGRATVEFTGQEVQNMSLKDDGVGADTLAGDGVFSGIINPSAVRRTGYYSVNGVLENPSSGLRRTGQLGVLQVLTLPNVAPPGRVTNLDAEANADFMNVSLTWTAVGEELYTGTASSYEIRFSDKMNFTFSNGFNLPSAIYSRLVPLPAGSTQELTFTSQEAGLNRITAFSQNSNSTVFCFKIVAKNNLGTSSEVSNVATTMFGEPNNIDEMFPPDSSTTMEATMRTTDMDIMSTTSSYTGISTTSKTYSTSKMPLSSSTSRSASTSMSDSTSTKLKPPPTSTLRASEPTTRQISTESPPQVSTAPRWTVVLTLPQFLAVVAGGILALLLIIVLATVAIGSIPPGRNKVTPTNTMKMRKQRLEYV